MEHTNRSLRSLSSAGGFMRRFVIILSTFLFLTLGQLVAQDRIDLRSDASEADAVLAILTKQDQHQRVTDADWQKLFSSEPYIRLKKRESAMHREFTDEGFRKFVLSP